MQFFSWLGGLLKKRDLDTTAREITRKIDECSLPVDLLCQELNETEEADGLPDAKTLEEISLEFDANLEKNEAGGAYRDHRIVSLTNIIKQEPALAKRVKKRLENRNVLVFASINEIFVLDHQNKAYKIAQLPYLDSIMSSILSLYSTGDKIYHVESRYSERSSKARYLIKETRSQTIIAERKKFISSLCLHDQILYDGGEYGIMDTTSDKIIIERDGYDGITALCSHNKKLYHADWNTNIFDTFDNRLIAKREDEISSLCSHNGKLFDSSRHGKIFETFSGELIKKLRRSINSICSHRGKLYDAYNKIYDTSAYEAITKRHEHITAICSHPRKYFVERGILKEI